MALFWVFAGIAIIGLICYCLQIWAVRAALKKRHETAEYYPPISILKPLKGLDDNLFDNLSSFCMQDYPKYEIIFAIQDHNDPAYKVARKVKDKYRDRDISIIVERCEIGLNPKVNNLIPAYEASKYPYILISDSNVMVEDDYLKKLATHMADPNVGLVSNIIRGVGGRTLGSILENLHMNSFIVGSVCFLDKFLKMPCVIGKSMLMKKTDLEAIGGFKAVKDFLAEDYVIGEKIHKMGKTVVLSNYAINNVNEYWGIRRFLNRHTRWGKIRWKIGGIKYISELIGNPVFMSFILMMVWEISRTTVLFALFVSLIKIWGDLYLGKITNSDSNPLIYLLSPVKDMIIGLIWFAPILSSTVVWRGNRYVIGKDSILSPCPNTGILSWRYRLVDAIKAKFV